MSKKFNIQTADRQGLVDRVTQLTTALVKQKDVISKLKSSEENILSENEKLQKQIRILEEENSMGRELRGELQNEVARLQRSIELLSAEVQMHNDNIPGTSSSGVFGVSLDTNVKSIGESGENGADHPSNGVSYQSHLPAGCDSQSQKSDFDSLHEHLQSVNELLLQISDLAPASCIGDYESSGHQQSHDDRVSESGGFASVVCAAAALLPRNISSIDVLAKNLNTDSSSKPEKVHNSLDGNESDLQMRPKLPSNTVGNDSSSTARIERELQFAEQGRLQAEERLRATHQAYVQAKKCIEDLERSASAKERELATLRQAQQRRSDAEMMEAQRREQETGRLAAAEAHVAALEQELRAADERLAQAARDTKALQARIAAVTAAAQEREMELEGALRRAEEKETQARRELEIARGGLESARREVRQTQEEKALQLEVDKKIIRGLQIEGRARAAELEARIASLEALLRDTHANGAVGFLGSPDDTPHRLDTAPSSAPSTPASLPVTVGAGIGVFGPAVSDGDKEQGVAAGAAGGGRGEELVRRSLQAMEDMVEALMRRPDLCRRIDADLAALETQLGPTPGRDALERRVDALCGVVHIAADYLQEIPCPEHRVAVHHDAAQGDSAVGAARRCVWAALRFCCCWGRGGAGGPAYAPVRSSGDYDDNDGL